MRKVVLILVMISAMVLTSCAQDSTGSTCTDGTLSDSPPDLIVTCGESSVTALKSGYTWESNDGGELESAVIACGAHPLQCRDITPAIVLGEERNASLTFGGAPQPDKLEILCYSTDDWDNMEARGKVKDIMASVPPEIRLGKGTIYVVNAEWTAADGYGGKAEYSFYIS